MTVKRCTICTKNRALKFFHNNAKAKDGKQSQCKKCHTTYVTSRNKEMLSSIALPKETKKLIAALRGVVIDPDNNPCTTYDAVLLELIRSWAHPTVRTWKL
tara:strand:- start:4067 stop:4369 length:303 start_codon:yes stop_codon:yes gene_type:complete